MLADTRVTTVERVAAAASAPGLTAEALYEVLRLLQQSREWARLDQQANGADGKFAAAALHEQIYLDEAYDHLIYLNEWLETNGLGALKIIDAAVAFEIFSYLRDAVVSLGMARHWALLSAGAHHSRAAARAYETATEAQRAAAALSDAASRQYLNAHQPLA